MPAIPSLSTVGLAAVTDGQDEDQQYPVVGLVDDAVVAGAHAPLIMPSDELLRASEAGLLGEQLNNHLDPTSCSSVQEGYSGCVPGHFREAI